MQQSRNRRSHCSTHTHARGGAGTRSTRRGLRVLCKRRCAVQAAVCCASGGVLCQRSCASGGSYTYRDDVGVDLLLHIALPLLRQVDHVGGSHPVVYLFLAKIDSTNECSFVGQIVFAHVCVGGRPLLHYLAVQVGLRRKKSLMCEGGWWVCLI